MQRRIFWAAPVLDDLIQNHIFPRVKLWCPVECMRWSSPWRGRDDFTHLLLAGPADGSSLVSLIFCAGSAIPAAHTTAIGFFPITCMKCCQLRLVEVQNSSKWTVTGLFRRSEPYSCNSNLCLIVWGMDWTWLNDQIFSIAYKCLQNASSY